MLIFGREFITSSSFPTNEGSAHRSPWPGRDSQFRCLVAKEHPTVAGSNTQWKKMGSQTTLLEKGDFISRRSVWGLTACKHELLLVRFLTAYIHVQCACQGRVIPSSEVQHAPLDSGWEEEFQVGPARGKEFPARQSYLFTYWLSYRCWKGF